MGEPSDNPFQYTGRENDNTGLYYYRARYYSSYLKRFISEDPIGLMGGVNFYSYVNNSSINWTDPLGLEENLAEGIVNMLEVANEYIGMFRDMRQINNLYRDVESLAYKYECGERVKVTIFLRRTGPYYDYVGVALGWEHYVSPDIIFVQDKLIGYRGCENLRRCIPISPQFQQR